MSKLTTKAGRLFMEETREASRQEQITRLLMLLWFYPTHKSVSQGILQLLLPLQSLKGTDLVEVEILVRQTKANLDKKQFDVVSALLTDIYQMFGEKQPKTRTMPGYALHVGRHPIQLMMQHLEDLSDD